MFVPPLFHKSFAHFYPDFQVLWRKRINNRLYISTQELLRDSTKFNSQEQIETIRAYAYRAFKGLQLRDLSRIDFFLSDKGEILINEINTFPGMTPISMFPKLLEHHGWNMTDFFTGCIERALARKEKGQY